MKKHFSVDTESLWKMENSPALDSGFLDLVKVDRAISNIVLMTGLLANPFLILPIFLE